MSVRGAGSGRQRWQVGPPPAVLQRHLQARQDPAPPETDPAYWSPTPEQISAFQGADLILLNGAGYVRWAGKASLPSSRTVNTSAGFEDLYSPEDEVIVHAHGPAGEHEYGNVAFTTWLDPALAGAFETGIAAFEEIDDRIESIVAMDPERPWLASHPVYQHLARRYDLNLESVHFEPDDSPGAAGWRELGERNAVHHGRWMPWEAEPLPETRVRLIDQHGIRSLVFVPCANRPAEGDFLATIWENVARLQAAFQEGD